MPPTRRTAPANQVQFLNFYTFDIFLLGFTCTHQLQVLELRRLNIQLQQLSYTKTPSLNTVGITHTITGYGLFPVCAACWVVPRGSTNASPELKHYAWHERHRRRVGSFTNTCNKRHRLGHHLRVHAGLWTRAVAVADQVASEDLYSRHHSCRLPVFCAANGGPRFFLLRQLYTCMYVCRPAIETYSPAFVDISAQNEKSRT